MKHEEGNFKGFKDFKIYFQAWLPENKPIAVLLVAHGFAEHSGRYGNLVDYFIPRGYAIYAPDHRGHGRSDGERVQVDDFHDYIVDLKTFFDIVKLRNPEQKIFLIGHSMGSIISLTYALEYQYELAGLITSAGGIIKQGDPPMPPPPPGKSLPISMLSRDPAVIAAYKNDPLVYHGPVPPNHAMRSMMGLLAAGVQNITLPVLAMAGGSERPRCQALYDLIGSQDKTIKIYDGLLHEIFNEPEHLQVMADIEKWLSKFVR
ncbi:MAG: lysophospholipase [Dehalococcoidales bacterium]|nr:lysophospholipase [Dehalococcoidales bacterium]